MNMNQNKNKSKEYLEQKFLHDLANKIMAMDGKMKKLLRIVDENTLIEVQKLDKTLKEMILIFNEYKSQVRNQD